MDERYPGQRGSTLEGARAAGERRGGPRPIAGVAARLAAPIVAGRGGGRLARLKAAWPAVIGSALAEVSWPLALGRDGALRLCVAGGIALELQHRAPLLIERINRFFGTAAVTRLTLVQGPLPLPAAPRRRPPAVLPAALAAELEARVAAVAEPALREALLAFGRLLLAAQDHR